MREVEATGPRQAGVETPVRADFQMRVVETEVGAAHGGNLHARVLHQEAGVEADAPFVGALAYDAQRIVAGFNERARVLMGATEHEVVPAVDVVAEKLTDRGVVQHGAAFAEAEGNSLHRRAGELVDAGCVLLAAHGRLVAIDVRVPAVVVEPDARCCHLTSPLPSAMPV